MQRREFLKGIAVAMAAGCTQQILADAATTSTARTDAVTKLASDRMKLGASKIEVSRLGFGTGTKGWKGSSNQTRGLGLQGLADLLRAAYDNGVTFWDSADMYGSHAHIGKALKGIAREKITIQTKSMAKTADEMRADVERFRKELSTDYIDIVLLHCTMEGDWNARRRGAMDYLVEAKQKGLIRAHGVSCHTLDALKTAAAEPWVDVDFARINPEKVLMDADPETVKSVLREMKKKGKGVIGMKILGEGKLRSRADEMLKYALELDCIDAFVIGIENRSEFDDLLKRIKAAGVPPLGRA